MNKLFLLALLCIGTIQCVVNAAPQLGMASGSSKNKMASNYQHETGVLQIGRILHDVKRLRHLASSRATMNAHARINDLKENQ
uniref:Uncharacterized protein n=1 Tax=Globodera rostochiensis TaxID=31243 RepID=A0A914IG04_GLORO